RRPASSCDSLALEGERLQRRELAAAVVLPDLVHGRADVAVGVEVDWTERTLVIDVLVLPQQRDRLPELQEGDLCPRRTGDRDEVALDLRWRCRARLHRGEERDVRGVEGGAFETGVRLRSLHVFGPGRVEGVARRTARGARRGTGESDHGLANPVEGRTVLQRL